MMMMIIIIINQVGTQLCLKDTTERLSSCFPRAQSSGHSIMSLPR